MARLIDLDEAIDKIRTEGVLGAGYDASEREDDVCAMLESCNIVDAAPVVHGRWEWVSGDVYRCTNCGSEPHVQEVMGMPDYDFCPFCGAKMDGA